MCELTDIGLQRYGAGRLLEFEGRQRRYRYYTYKTYKMLHEGIDLEIPPLPEQDMDESGLFEADYSVDAIRTAKGFRTYLNSTTSRIISVKGAGRKTGKLFFFSGCKSVNFLTLFLKTFLSKKVDRKNRLSMKTG